MKIQMVIIILLLFVISFECNAECVSGDCVNGKGTMVVPNGLKYVGQFKNGNLNGQGTLTFPNGDKYVGQWKDNLRNGLGTATTLSGVKYVGEWKNNKFDGQGTITKPDGDKYIGQWKKDKMSGQGTYTYASGSVYVGQWKDGTWNGQGSYTSDKGGKSVGQYKDGKQNGQGSHTYTDGSKYVGQWKDNRYDGQGTLVYSDGNKYVGEWKNGKYYGKGTYTYADDGSMHVGQWKNGKKHGKGVFKLSNGAKYDGQWKNGKHNGQGTQIYNDGSKYVGQWKNDKRSGQGTLTYADGGKYVGQWKDDKINGDGVSVSPLGTKIVGQWKDDKTNGNGTLTDADGTKYAVTYRAGKETSRTPLNHKQEKIDLNNIDFGDYYALVIGNNNYRHIPKLKTAKNDAKSIATLLEKEYAFKVTHLEDVTREQLIDSLTRYRRILSENDNLLIYYAGHGYLDNDTSRGYWLPVDSKQDSKANWVANSDIVDTLKAIKAKHILVVADSCFSGTLTRDTRSIIRIQQRKKTDGYLAMMSRKKTRVALTSGGIEPVEDGNGDHSVFNKYFRKALLENHSILDSASLYPAIKRLVMMNAHQAPEYSDIRFTGSDGGDFLFIRK